MALFNDPILLGGNLMHHRIDSILKRLRQVIAQNLGPESIRSACRAAGHSWRRCTLSPVVVVHGFILQIFYGNASN